jgi:hypothetical protein
MTRAALKDDESRSILIGLGATLLFHVLLFSLAPLVKVEHIGGSGGSFFGLTGAQLAKNKEFNIELAPDEIKAPAPEKTPFKFVETNPDAPDNAPDKTENFSSRNQQLAQKEPDTASKLTAPKTEGREDLESAAIVSGSLAPPELGAPPTPEVLANQAERAAQEARAQQIPLSGTEKIEGKAADGIGADISTNKSPSNNAKEFVEGAKDGKSATGGLVVVTEQQKQAPRERRRISQSQARPNVLQNRQFGTDRVGPVGMDARWSDFGEYLQQYIETVHIRWEGILSERQTFPPSPSHVVITFTLTAEGVVTATKVEASTTDRPGELAAMAAIAGKVEAFKPWTEAMIAVMGREQTLTFRFHY